MEENTQKLCFIDTETTGLDAGKNGVHQISFIITDIDAEVVYETADLMFTPHPDVVRDSGHFTLKSDEELDSREMTSHEASIEMIRVLDKHVNKYDKKDKLQFVAYNASFDEKFLRAFFEQHSSTSFGSYFWTPSICCYAAMGFFVQSKRKHLPNMRLGTMCSCAGIAFDGGEAHDGLYDVKKTVELYKYLRQNLSVL